MGFMSWQFFRCNGPGANGPTDNCTDPSTTYCISAALILGQAEAMVARGFTEKGYLTLSIDDCWMSGRDPTSHELVAWPVAWPGGTLAPTAAAVHALGMKLGTYTAESTGTCCGHVASEGYEAVDADSFAAWGVDYLKVDGCNSNASYYAVGYPLMGAALEVSGRDIVYSCSWPDYTMCDVMHDCGNISVVDWGAVINAGCNQFRVWRDINCNSGDLFEIIDHFGDWAWAMSPIHGPGHWFDADQLLIGAECLSIDEEKTQLAIWAILAQPLFVSADFRNMSLASAEVLLNEEAIAIDQDALGQMGLRLEATSAAPLQRWSRRLANGDVAAVLLNRHGVAGACPSWDINTTGYKECCGGCCNGFSNLTITEADAMCCSMGVECAGFSITASAQTGAPGNGCFKSDIDCFQPSSGFIGISKPDWPPPTPSPSDISLNFSDVGFEVDDRVNVFDVWAKASLGVFTGSFTAMSVPFHGNAFLRLSKVA